MTRAEHSDNSSLRWDLFVTPGIPAVADNPPPGEKRSLAKSLAIPI